MISDKAIENSRQDILGRKHFSKKVAQIISQRDEEDSVVIGIHAPWGEGKTSVLNMIVEYLDNYIYRKQGNLFDGHIVIVKFNPWRFADEEQLLRNFFNTLANALETSIETKKQKAGKVGKHLSNYSPVLDMLKIRLGWGAASIEPNISETLKKYTDLLSENDIEKQKRRIDKILKNNGKRILIIMDDIDRLDRSEIQAVFRLIKLTADFKNTIYLMFFDDERVAQALEEKSGKDFTEKIIQLSLELPPLTPLQLTKLAFSKINSLLEESKVITNQERDGDWSYFFKVTFSDFLKSPRLVKKYINSLLFALSDPNIKNELYILDLLTIEAVHIFFPKLYKIIRKNRNMFLLEPTNEWFREKEEKQYIEKLKLVASEFLEHEKESIEKIILNLFPQTESAFTSRRVMRWSEQSKQEKRISVPQYFLRYFSLGISDDDIGDVELEAFINNLNRNSVAQNKAGLEKIISNDRQELFFDKVFELAKSLSPETAVHLAKVIAASVEVFPKGDMDSLFLGVTMFSYAARLTGFLLDKIADIDQKTKLAVELTAATPSLEFAYEFFQSVRNIGKIENDSNREEPGELGKAVVKKLFERIKTEGSKTPLENNNPHMSGRLYEIWFWEDRQSVKEYLKTRIDNNNEEAEKFVLSFCKQSWLARDIGEHWGFDFIVSAIEKMHPDLEIQSPRVLIGDEYSKEDYETMYLYDFVQAAKNKASVPTLD